MTHDDAGRTATSDDDARDDVAAITRGPLLTAAAAGLVALGMAAALIRSGRFVAGPLILGIPAALMVVVCLWQRVRFTPGAIRRMESFALRVGGRFTPLTSGPGNYTALIFRHGAQMRRFGVLGYATEGTRIEMGHLLSSSRYADARSIERRHAYAVIDLPARMPHMIIDFGHLRRFLGIRMTPEHWHRSQLVDVGGGRRFRLFVVDSGEHIARRFFTAEMVRVCTEVGRHYDVEINERRLYLLSSRSMAAGSDRRWERQRTLIERLAAAVAGSPTWDVVGRPRKGRESASGGLVMDVRRGIWIVLTVAIAACAILTAIALYAEAQGFWNV